MDYWQRFRLNSSEVPEVMADLKKLERSLPDGFGKKYGNYNVYVHKKPRVSEISINISAPAMMVSLRQSMDEFNQIRKCLQNTALELGKKADKIMLSHDAWKISH